MRAEPAPFLCVVMPVLDEGGTLGAHLAELQPMRRRGVRLVVVDGGSTDDTVRVAQPLVDEVRVGPRGRAMQQNAGAAGQTAEVLLFLHADTRLPVGADALVRTALAGPRGRPARDWGRFDVRIDSPRPLLRMVSAAMNLRSHLSGIVTGDQSVFVRRRLFEEVGGFPAIPLMEDIALSALLRRRGRPARLRARVRTSARRWERHGVWRTIVLMWRTRLEYALGADPARLAVRYGYAPADPSPPSP